MDDFMAIIFKPIAESIKEFDRLSERQHLKWPDEVKTGKVPGESYRPVKELEDDADADRRSA